MAEKIGFIGLGIMGKPMALNLIKAGHTLVVNDINQEGKDLTNVMETAHDLDVPLPLSSNLLEIFHALKADGKVLHDHCGIVEYYEKIANVEVRPASETVSTTK